MPIPDEDPNEKKTSEPIAAPAEDSAPASTPEELGGHTNEGGAFESDFGEIIDKLAPAPARDESGKFVATKAEPEKAGGEAAAEEPEKKPEAAKAIEEAIAPAAEKKVESPATTDRDSDLKELESKLDPHASPKTRNHFKAQQQAVIEARNRADAAAAEAQRVKDELAAAKAAGVPKEIDDELKQLRETVRELDAARDPALQAKYDKRITSNNDAIISVLTKNGFGKDREGKDLPGVVDALKKSGLTRATLQDKIDALEKAGEHEAADEVKELLRENNRLGREKESEVANYRTTYEQRAQQHEAENVKRVELANKRMVAEFKSHADKFDYLQPPPPVKPEDVPAIRKEKEKAIAGFNDRINRISEAIKKETATPEDAGISARVGILYRDHVLPHVQSQLEEARKEVESLKAKMKAMQGAGSIGEKVGTGKIAPPPKQDDDTTGSSFDELIDRAAKSAGVR